MKPSVYLAGSWNNRSFDPMLRLLKAEGLEVFDFRKVSVGYDFRTIAIELRDGHKVGNERLNDILTDPRSRTLFMSDMWALQEADFVILMLDSGFSAHMELAFACGRSSVRRQIGMRPVHTLIVQSGPVRPELMYAMAERIAWGIADAMDAVRAMIRADRIWAPK